MARPTTKTKVTEGIPLKLPVEVGPAIHHMVRGLGGINDGNGIFTADEIDAHCQTWLDQGYKLMFLDAKYNPQGVGQGGMVNDQANWHILYVFTKE